MKTIFLYLFILLSVAVKAQEVYKTPSGKKYHVGSCRMVNNVSEKVTINQALKLGLVPCKICNPPVMANQQGFISNTVNGESLRTVQCKGMTKKGIRCRHMTSIANGYCFQHNPDN